VGTHAGAYGFTIGQRRGLGVSTGDQRPRYVLGIEPVSRTVTIGTAEQAEVDEVVTQAPTWTGPVPELPCRASVQLRAHGTPVDCTVSGTEEGGLRIEFTERQRGVAPGQSAVLYAPDADRGDRVLGQGTVLRAGERSAALHN
jgi:tRNA-uridine 2-sulfurtransferase